MLRSNSTPHPEPLKQRSLWNSSSRRPGGRERYGSNMKTSASLIFFAALASSQITSALEFSGATLTEQEIYALWGKNNCKPFMVNSASSKTSMPKVLAHYLNSDASYREIKIITCKYKTVDIEFYLTQKKSRWIMFSGEAVTIPSKNSP